jgi:RNA recognition motif-containing protein
VAALHKSKLEGRTITVERSQSLKKEATVGYTVHVSNLSYKIARDDELRLLFEERFGEVKKAHLVKDDHGRSKGFGFVEFIEEASMDKAVKEKEIQLKDRLAIVKRSTRQIIPEAPPSSPADRQKKRDTKKERKKIISDIIAEATQEEAAKPEPPKAPEAPPSQTMSNSAFKSMLFGSKK